MSDDMVIIELSREDAEWLATHDTERMASMSPRRQRIGAACVEALEIDRLLAENEAARLEPATLPELGFTHIANCRHCGQAITIAKWTHVSGGDWPSGNEANADHNPMPDPATVKEWEV